MGRGVAGGAKAGVRSAIVTEGVSEYYSVTGNSTAPSAGGSKEGHVSRTNCPFQARSVG